MRPPSNAKEVALFSIHDLVELVFRMRNAQRAYFRAKKASQSNAAAHYQAAALLEEARALEREVDAAIEAARHYLADQKQTKIF